MNFAVVFGASLWSGYALPACHPENGTTTATGRGSTYQARKPVQTKPTTSQFGRVGAPESAGRIGAHGAGYVVLIKLPVRRPSDPLAVKHSVH